MHTSCRMTSSSSKTPVHDVLQIQRIVLVKRHVCFVFAEELRRANVDGWMTSHTFEDLQPDSTYSLQLRANFRNGARTSQADATTVKGSTTQHQRHNALIYAIYIFCTHVVLQMVAEESVGQF